MDKNTRFKSFIYLYFVLWLDFKVMVRTYISPGLSGVIFLGQPGFNFTEKWLSGPHLSRLGRPDDS